MLSEPARKRTVAFFDGQNLFHAAREAFGYSYPNYDPRLLATKVCEGKGWHLDQVRFYTGIPSEHDNSHWNYFWSAKLGALGHAGVHVFSRPLRYRNKTIRLPDGSEQSVLTGEEKGVDVRIALDVIRLGFRKDYDVALLFSQDQDLSEVAKEIRAIAQEQGRWIKIASAFPASPTSRNLRGINGSDWIKIDRETYNACIDPKDYRRPRDPK